MFGRGYSQWVGGGIGRGGHGHRHPMAEMMERGRGGGRRRLFDGGELKLLLLKLAEDLLDAGAGEITDLSASRSTPANPDVHDSASAIRSSEAHSDTPGTQTGAGSKEGR